MTWRARDAPVGAELRVVGCAVSTRATPTYRPTARCLLAAGPLDELGRGLGTAFLMFYAFGAMLLVAWGLACVASIVRNRTKPTPATKNAGVALGLVGVAVAAVIAWFGSGSLVVMLVALAACGLAFAALFTAARASIALPSPPRAAMVRCLRCDVQSLVRANADDVAVVGCSLCGGIWLDTASAARIARSAPAAVVSLVDRVVSAASAEPHLDETVACPLCGRPLVRRRLTPSGVEVHGCEGHGIWLDRGAVERLIGASAGEPPAPDSDTRDIDELRRRLDSER